MLNEHAVELATNGREALAKLQTSAPFDLVITDRAMPAAQPVNYILDGEEIVFRTANGSKLAAATRHAVVGFQVDEIDPRTRTGWSVLGVGEANEVVHPDRLAELADLSDPWVDDHDAHTISVSLQIISGRRLQRAAPRQADARAPSASEPGRTNPAE